METNDYTFREFARQVCRGVTPHSAEGRARIEATLLPIVRSAMRTGHGPAPVVDFVRRNVPPQGWPSDLSAAARPLVLQVCENLVDRMSPQSSRDTVIGP